MRKKKVEDDNLIDINNKESEDDIKIHTVEPEELLQDNSVICSFTIFGKPVTKKNHGTIIHSKGRHVLLPSPQYKKYEVLCQQPCEDAWIKKGKKPMNYGIAIYVQVYLDTWSVGDHCGYLQAIGDILQKFKVIEDDKWIHWMDDGKHWFGGISKENPRVEIEIRRFRHPYEEYRKDKEEKLQKKLKKKQQFAQ